MTDESDTQRSRDFDGIEINIRINDEIVTNEEFRANSMITEEELEASKHDSVEMHLHTMTEDILRRYNECREGGDSD